jgi:hypothetical protein
MVKDSYTESLIGADVTIVCMLSPPPMQFEFLNDLSVCQVHICGALLDNDQKNLQGIVDWC